MFLISGLLHLHVERRSYTVPDILVRLKSGTVKCSRYVSLRSNHSMTRKHGLLLKPYSVGSPPLFPIHSFSPTSKRQHTHHNPSNRPSHPHLRVHPHTTTLLHPLHTRKRPLHLPIPPH
jgi:hypothetical protein